MRSISVLCFLALALCATAFSPATPTGLKLRAPAAATSLRMAETPKQNLNDEKSNNPISLFLDSVVNIFKKSEDDYPAAEPASGFTQTPNKPTRNKEWS